jgi:TP901 family phage tail tape measure protein
LKSVEGFKVSIGASISDFNAGMASVQKSAKNAFKQLDSQFKKIEKSGLAAMGAISLGVGKSVHSFMKFDHQLRSVKTLLSDNSFKDSGRSLSEGFRDMQSSMLELAKSTPQAMSDLNSGLFDAVSSGIKASEAVGFVASAANLATAGLSDVKTTTDGMTTAINAFGLNAAESDILAAKFFETQKQGKLTIQELSSSIGNVASTASAMGVSLDEVLASTAALTQTGLKSSESMTALKAMMSNIAKPTAAAQKEAERLGITFNETSLRTKGLEGFLNSLKNANGFTEESVNKLFGSTEAVNAVFGLTGKQFENFTNITRGLGDEQKILAGYMNGVETQTDSLQNQMSILKNRFEVIFVKIGQDLSPVLEKVTKLFNALFERLENDEEFRHLALSIAAGVTAFASLTSGVFATKLVFSQVMPVFGVFSKVLGFLPGLLISAATGTSTLAVGLRLLAGAAGFGVVIGAVAILASKWETVFPRMQEIFFKFKDVVFTIGKTVAGVLKSIFSGDFEGLKNIIMDSVNDLTSFVSSSEDIVEEKKKKALEGQNKFNAEKEINEAAHNERMIGIENNAHNLLSELQKARKSEGIEKKEEEKKRTLEEFEEEKKQKLAQVSQMQNEILELQKKSGDFALADKAAALQRERSLLENSLRETQILEQQFGAKKILAGQVLTNYEINELNKKVKTKDQVLKEMNLKEINQNIEAKNKLIEDEAKHGEVWTKMNRVRYSQNYQSTKKSLGMLSNLSKSNSKTLRSIGKASAISSILFNTYESAMQIFKGWSTIPFVGKALGIAEMMATISMGMGQVSKVRAARTGAFVTGGGVGRDMHPFMLSKYELVTPAQNYEEHINAVVNSRLNELEEPNRSAGSRLKIEIGFKDDAAQILTAQIIEGQESGILPEFS